MNKLNIHHNAMAYFIITLGVLFLLSNFIPVFQFKIIWPIILVIFGLGIMLGEFDQ